ncbi:MAG: SDR family oxidoreductase [Pygmaiobacter massiliensis]|nr:SDR family oxidoreductase [Pygmaiobacter massiliensis]
MDFEQMKTENLFSVKEKVVLITGAGGLGEVFAEGFAAGGAKVVLASRTKAKADAVCEKLTLHGVKAESYELDVAKKDQDYAVCEKVAADYGHLDVLVHTAALCKLHPVMEDCEDIFRENMDVNLMGSLFLNQAAGRIMAQQGGGSIININTHSAFSVNSKDGFSYGVSKAALMQLTKWFAVELAEKNVTVNGIAPIWIDTPMMARRPKDYLKKAIEQVPMGRMSQAEDYLGLALFLASPASRFITGQTFLVDGGWGVSRRFNYDPEA